MASITESLASFVARTGYEDLSAHAVERAKVHFLDWVAACCAGAATPAGRILLEYACQDPEPGSLTAFGLPDRRGVRQAPFINGALAKASQLDDMDRVSTTHLAAPVCPAALAVGELRGRSGRDLLRAIVLGYEVGSRIGEAAGTRHFDYWQKTATCGIFGAATAAGILLDLDEPQLVGALGNAGAQGAGLLQATHDNQEYAVSLPPGKAASDGLFSAQLAGLGFLGAPNILEGRSGLFAATCRNPMPEVATAGLDRSLGEFRIEQVSIKRWPSGMYTYTAVLAAMAIAKKVSAGDIESITISTCGHTLNLVDKPNPTTVLSARYSVQFGVAIALAFGGLGRQHFAREYLEDPRIVSLMRRTKVQDAPDLEPYYPRRWPSRVTVRTLQGAVLEETVIDCPGGPEAPLSFQDVVGKLKEYVGEVLTPDAVDRLVDRTARLESVERTVDLFDGVVGSPPSG